jgi:NTE family protein
MAKSPLILRLALYVLAGCCCVLLIAVCIPPNPYVVHPDRARDRAPVDALPGFRTADTLALCLSGGGYRAVLFELGATKRLDELSLLKSIDHVSSVSGGSILAAYLVLHWSDLYGDGALKSKPDFDGVVTKPVSEFTSTKVESWKLLRGLWGRHSIAMEVAGAYEHSLFKKHETLRDLPSKPRLVINATRLDDGTLWTFGQDGITSGAWLASGSNGWIGDDRELPLAIAVAASSAYPPVLGPLHLDISQLVPSAAVISDRIRRSPLETDLATSRDLDAAIAQWRDAASHLSLIDGGVLNNQGTEWCSGIGLTFSVNAGLPDSVGPVRRSWAAEALHVIDLMFSVKEIAHTSLRNTNAGLLSPRPLYVNLADVADLAEYSEYRDSLPEPARVYVDRPLRALAVALTQTRLVPPSPEERAELINLGYLMADYAVWLRLKIPEAGTLCLQHLMPSTGGAPVRLPMPVPACLLGEVGSCSTDKKAIGLGRTYTFATSPTGDRHIPDRGINVAPTSAAINAADPCHPVPAFAVPQAGRAD